MNKRVSLVLFTIAVTVVFIAPISFAYLVTRPIVALNEEAYLKRAVLAAAGIEPPADNAAVRDLFDNRWLHLLAMEEGRIAWRAAGAGGWEGVEQPAAT